MDTTEGAKLTAQVTAPDGVMPTFGCVRGRRGTSMSSGASRLLLRQELQTIYGLHDSLGTGPHADVVGQIDPPNCA
jgi:hypothetical protein